MLLASEGEQHFQFVDHGGILRIDAVVMGALIIGESGRGLVGSS
jgi:hypothetical protein